MELRVLGRVELWVAGRRIEVGPPKQQCVLAVLALAGNPVSAGTLIDRVWGGDQPRDTRNVLYTYIARLRRLLSSPVSHPMPVLRREPGGYVLDLAPEQVDAQIFQILIKRSQRAGDDEQRHAHLSEALGRWRGVPFTGLTGEWVETMRAGLEQQWRNAVADRIDIDLRRGLGTELIDEITDLVAAHPLTERFPMQLMLALSRAGHTAEALAVYQRTRHRLADELGIDPGPELQRLHQEILRRETGTSATATTDRAPSAGPPRQLPMAPATFVGREAELAALARTLQAEQQTVPPIAVITGSGGIGKSALALRAAHDASSHYPDGQLYVDLQGASPGLKPLQAVEVLGRFIRALGVPTSGTPSGTEEAAALLRTLLVDKQLLLLLDNAADAAQVRPLLPASEGCAALITCRSQSSTLDSTLRIDLRVLPNAVSVALLNRLDPTGRLASRQSLAHDIAQLCGHLPLALRIAAARMASRPDWPLDRFVGRLVDRQQRLEQLGHEDLSVRACFDVSYQSLTYGGPADQDAARAFRMLGLPEGTDISLPIAARLIDVPESRAEASLERLVDARLLDAPTHGRYRMHDLLRLYARELSQALVPEEERYAALDRTWRCYVATAVAASQLIRPGYRQGVVAVDPHVAIPLPGREQARTWLREERMNLLAAGEQAATTPGDYSIVTVQIAHVMFDPLRTDSHWANLEHLNERALEVARERGDSGAEALVLCDLGVAAWLAGDGDRALSLFLNSLALRRDTGEHLGTAITLLNLASIYSERGEYDEALRHCEEALAAARLAAYPSGQAVVLTTMGKVRRDLGELDAADALLRRSLEISRRLGDRRNEAIALDDLGITALKRTNYTEAVEHFHNALTINSEFQIATSTAWNLVGLGAAYRHTGEPQHAAEACEEALGISRQIGAHQEEARALWQLGHALTDLGEPEQAEARWREALPIFERLGTPEAAALRTLLGLDGPER